MAAVIQTLRDEVASTLTTQSAGWAYTFSAVAKFQPKFDFEDVDSLQVQVVPLTWSKAPSSRDLWEHEYVIGVGIHRRLAALDTTIFNNLLQLCEQISDYYEDNRATTSDCVLMGIEFGGATGAPYNHETIETQNTFTSVIQLTFRKYR